MLQTRVKRLFDIICDEKNYYTAAELADKLEVSLKTVRNDIKELQKIFVDHGGVIRSKAGKGYAFVTVDKKKYKDFLKSNWHRFAFYDEGDLNLRENRIRLLLKILLEEKGFIREDDLAERVAVGKSLLSLDLKEIKARLKNFNLRFETRPHHGIQVVGNEMDFRKMISQCFFQRVFSITIEEKEKQQSIRAILNQTFTRWNYCMTDAAYENLINHLFLTLKRMANGQYICLTDEVMEQLQRNPEYKIAEDIVTHIEQCFHLKIEASEKGYITMHLSGKRLYEKMSCPEMQILPEVDALVMEIFQQIKKELKINLCKDLDLRISLGLHMMVLVKRIHYHLSMKNPLLIEVKRCALAFEMAVMAARKINVRYECSIDEDEIGYLALHFSVGLDRLSSQIKRKRILLVCSTGRGTAQLLKYRFQEEFSQYVAELKTVDLHSLPKVLTGGYDFIVSTVPVTISTQIPVLLLDSLLSGEDLIHIRNTLDKSDCSLDMTRLFSKELFLTEISALDRQTVLQMMCKQICACRDLQPGFYESVLRREEQSSTDYENLIAIPHSDKPKAADSFAAIAILPKPVLWYRRKVQLVVLFHMGTEHTMDLQEFYRKLWRFLTQGDLVKIIIKKKSYEMFLDVMKHI